MIQWRTETRWYIDGGKNDRWITHELIREICHRLESPSDLFTCKHILGATRKVISKLMSGIGRPTRRDPRLGSCPDPRRIERLCERCETHSAQNPSVHKAESTMVYLVITADVLEGRLHGTSW
jgi:hypothetical protein